MNKLIFDLGFLNGEDSDNYIKKGFKVVAVEANPVLFDKAKERFAAEIAENKLILLNRAMTSSIKDCFEKKGIDFYINKERPEVSSTEKWIATQNGKYEVEKVSISPISIVDLISEYGVPFYIKIDVEGIDKEIIENILTCHLFGAFSGDLRPKYLSAELNKGDYLSIFLALYGLGYTEFQLRNQIHNEKNTSGDFGDDLPSDQWLTIGEALSRYMKYRELKIIDNVNLGVGWLDVHARHYN